MRLRGKKSTMGFVGGAPLRGYARCVERQMVRSQHNGHTPLPPVRGKIPRNAPSDVSLRGGLKNPAFT